VSLVSLIPGVGPIVDGILGGLQWVWGHKTLTALIGVALYAAVQTHRLGVRTIERDAATTQIDAYKHDVESAENRAAETAATAQSYLDAYNRMKARAAELDAAAGRQARVSAEQLAESDRAKTAAEARLETLPAEQERKAAAPGATAAELGRAAIAGLGQ
jgi:uncharacterized membrane-anchored protein YhcB (DUF1043 family)